MAKPTKEEFKLKIKALKEAVKALKEKSKGKKNYVTYANVVEHANVSEYAKEFKAPISISSIKQAVSPKFTEIKLEIMNFRKTHTKIVKTTPNKLKVENESLTETVNNLMIQIAKILDREMGKDEKIKNLQASLDKAKEERNYYFKQTVKGDK